MRKVVSFLFYFVCALFLFASTALAYIDPSAMTYIIQIIAGVVIAGGAAFGFYWRKIKRKLSGLRKGESVQAGDQIDDDDKVGLDDYGIEASTAAPKANIATSAGASPTKRTTATVAQSAELDPYEE